MRPHATPTFGFSAINQNGNLKGEIEYQDHGCDINFHGKVTAAFVTFAVTSIEGSGTLEDGTPVTAEILWTPGFFGNPPLFSITLSANGQEIYTNEGPLIHGHIQPPYL
jgi:hypothetical protein